MMGGVASSAAGRYHRARRWWTAGVLVGSVCLSGCRAGPEVAADASLSRLQRSGAESFRLGDDQRAIDDFRQALVLAWGRDDPLGIGNSAFNYATALAGDGRLEEARDALAEARAELLRAGEPLDELWLLEAKIARRQGIPWRAEQLAEHVQACSPAVIAGPRSGKSAGVSVREQVQAGARRLAPHGRGEPNTLPISAALLRGQVACDQGAISEARRHLRQARAALPGEVPASLEAEFEYLRGRILLHEGEPLSAARAFDLEADALRAAELWRDLPDTYRRCAEAYLEAGYIYPAADRWIRVSRLWLVRGDIDAAIVALDSSHRLAEALSDTALLGRIDLVLGLIESALGPAVAVADGS
jgi:tetratricopeptide (TPR) repeat protein